MSRNEPPSDQEPHIKVTDRRKFTREGERIEPASASSSRASEEPTAESPGSTGPSTDATAGSEDLFVTHVMALSQLGMMHLGHIENPTNQQTTVDLPAAREVIDLLGMLQEKTRGNLTDEEKKLLDTWLYQLRMEFSRKAAPR